MRLKPIKPGMVIHCKNDMEYEQLDAEVIKLGYGRLPCQERSNNRVIQSIVFCVGTVGVGWEYVCDFAGEYIEFSDLILPELSAEEVFEIMAEMHKECYGKIDGCLGCPIRTVAEHCDADCFGRNAKAIIKVCEQWKADHEKKEPEIETEWFWQGRIYRVGDEGQFWQIKDGTGFYDTGCKNRESAEEYMSDILKEVCKEHEGNFIAVVERVCRVRQ